MSYDNYTLDVPAANQYPGSGGPTLGNFASAVSGFGRGGRAPAPTAAGVADNPSDEVSQAAEVGRRGNPIIALLAVAGALVLFMWGARKVGTDEDFKHIRLSFFNILTIGWAAIIVIWGSKIVFTKIKVPGLSTIVLGV